MYIRQWDQQSSVHSTHKTTRTSQTKSAIRPDTSSMSHDRGRRWSRGRGRGGGRGEHNRTELLGLQLTFWSGLRHHVLSYNIRMNMYQAFSTQQKEVRRSWTWSRGWYAHWPLFRVPFQICSLKYGDISFTCTTLVQLHTHTHWYDHSTLQIIANSNTSVIDG